MRELSIVMVLHPDGKRILMCHRTKDPYKGLYNVLGGKKEAGESMETCAYRELYEESGIGSQDIVLEHISDLIYYKENMMLGFYAGILRQEVVLREEKHPLCWISMKEDFGDETRFAGVGNLVHLVRLAQMYLLKDMNSIYD